MKNYILVTGVAGNIGSYLALSLLNKKYNVIGIDNLSTGTKKKLPNKDYKNFKFIFGDVNNKIKISNIFKLYNIKFVFHFDMSISQLRSKKTKRGLSKLMCSSTTLDVKEDEDVTESISKLVMVQSNVNERIQVFWVNFADRHLIPYLERTDELKLSLGKFLQMSMVIQLLTFLHLSIANKAWYGIINSKYLFSTIIKSIKEVTEEIKQR